MRTTTEDALKELWSSMDLPLEFLRDNLRLTGDPGCTLPTSFNLGVASQASIAAAGLASAYVYALSTGETQTVTVNARHAAIEFSSENYYTINERLPGGIWDDIAGTYPTKDDSFVRIHTNFPHHRAGVLSILKLDSTATRESVSQALSEWDSREFEDIAAKNGMCVTAMRSYEEWSKHPHALALEGVPPVQLIRISDAPKRHARAFNDPNGALGGLRVLDLTRVIAGPVCGRTLAAHGADVLWITSPNLPSLPNLDAETSRGKRTTQLDLTKSDDRETLASLVHDADVFLQAYRPGGISGKGFGPTDLAKMRPGIVSANLTAWGYEGPWKNRRGFDSLVQTATGFNVDEARAFASFQCKDQSNTPKPFPVQALDHAAGYLLTFGICAAIYKTIIEGGSWEVRVSLASVGNWIRSLGRIGPEGFVYTLPRRIYPPEDEIEVLSMRLKLSEVRKDARYAEGGDHSDQSGGRGTMIALRHSAILEKTPCLITEAPVCSNMDLPVWLPTH